MNEIIDAWTMHDDINAAKNRLVLIDARQILAENGWNQGSNMRNAKGLSTHYYEEAVSYCMLGAIFAAARKHAVTGVEAANLVSKTLWPSLPPHRAPPLHIWNDAKGRTKEAVLEVLDETIARTV